MTNSKFLLLIMSLNIFISCSSQEEQIADLPVDTTTTLETIAPTTSTTLETTTTTQVVYDGCIPEDNQDINFNDLKNVQNFLNRYGFDAGTEDGLSGNQTREAVKRFQAYVGITIDGDLGPTTYGKMNSYTGCEERINEYTSSSTSTTSTTIISEESTTESTTTTTTIPVTTTTTVIATTYDYGFQGMVSPESGNFADILTTQNENNTICSNIAPFYS